jgi:hypothetical protein
LVDLSEAVREASTARVIAELNQIASSLPGNVFVIGRHGSEAYVITVGPDGTQVDTRPMRQGRWCMS